MANYGRVFQNLVRHASDPAGRFRRPFFLLDIPSILKNKFLPLPRCPENIGQLHSPVAQSVDRVSAKITKKPASPRTCGLFVYDVNTGDIRWFDIKFTRRYVFSTACHLYWGSEPSSPLSRKRSFPTSCPFGAAHSGPSRAPPSSTGAPGPQKG